MKSNLKSWLVLTRCSNLPTVWSNIISGWLLGMAAVMQNPSVVVPSALSVPLFILLLGISLLYVAGMILNDVFDYEWDCKNRPERPLPSGLISRSKAKWIGAIVLLLGLALSVFSAGRFLNPTVLAITGLLVIFILWYDVAHKGNPLAPVIMGACRALLPVIGFMVATTDGVYVLPSNVYVYAAVLGIYTYALTWVAKYELTPAKNSYWIERLLFLIPLPLIVYGNYTYWSLGALIFYVLWIIFSNRRHPTPSGISARVADRIAAFSLLDSIVSGTILLMIARFCGTEPMIQVKEVAWLALLAPLICFGMTLWLRKFIPST
ncbi:MAG: UbiA family prenyltransferase [Opitutae bacterium]